MHEDTRDFTIIPGTIGAIVGMTIGGWVGSGIDLLLLGIILGGILGALGGIILGIILYKWAMEDLEEEWRHTRKRWRENDYRNNDK